MSLISCITIGIGVAISSFSPILGISCDNFSASALEETLQETYQFYENDHFPPNSCHMCSKPKCDFNDTACDKRSDLGPYPVYNKILEFTLYTPYMGVENIAKVALSDNCYIKINFKEVMVDGVRGHYSDVHTCLNSPDECHPMYNSTARKVSPFNCTNIALAFKGDNVFYIDGASGTICFDAPTFHLRTRTNNEIEDPQCHLNGSEIYPTVTFEFLQGDNRTYDGVPVFLPCSPGGFMVDDKTGMFLHGDNCTEIYDKPKYQNFSKDRGIGFVISEFYNENEDLIFPIRENENISDHIPIYINEDGNASSIEEMNPRPEPNQAKGENVRDACNYIPKPDSSCSSLNISTVEESLRNMHPSYANKKFPTNFCNTCGVPTCNFSDSSCGNRSSFGPLPVNNDTVEFVLFTWLMGTENVAKISISEKCYLEINFKVTESEIRSHTVQMQTCVVSGNSTSGSCTIWTEAESPAMVVEYRCSNIMVVLKKPKELVVSGGYGEICFDEPRTYFSNLTSAQKELSEECYMNNSVFQPTVTFEFLQGDNRKYDGVPVLLNCNPNVSGRSFIKKSVEDLDDGDTQNNKKQVKTDVAVTGHEWSYPCSESREQKFKNSLLPSSAFELDEDRAFLESLIPTIHQFDVDQKLTFRSEVLNIVQQIRKSNMPAIEPRSYHSSSQTVDEPEKTSVTPLFSKHFSIPHENYTNIRPPAPSSVSENKTVKPQKCQKIGGCASSINNGSKHKTYPNEKITNITDQHIVITRVL